MRPACAPPHPFSHLSSLPCPPPTLVYVVPSFALSELNLFSADTLTDVSVWQNPTQISTCSVNRCTSMKAYLTTPSLGWAVSSLVYGPLTHSSSFCRGFKYPQSHWLLSDTLQSVEDKTVNVLTYSLVGIQAEESLKNGQNRNWLIALPTLVSFVFLTVALFP